MSGPLRDLYGHSPVEKMFAGADVYGVGYEPERAGRAPVRLGFVGVGGVAQSKWLPALARLRTLWDPVSLVGVADPDGAQGGKVARLHGCRWYPDHERMLEEQRPDAVVVASPDALHYGHAADALAAGAAVLVEKPFCTRLQEAEQLLRLGRQKGAVVMPVCNLRFAPPLRRAHQAARSSTAFEPPVALLGKMHFGYDYVDLLEGATVHLFDLARHFLGDVVGLSARGLGRGAAWHPYPFRQAVISADFADGSAAQLFTSSGALSLKPWFRLELHGQGSWLEVDDVYQLSVYDDETGPTKSWRPVMANTLLLDEEFGGYLPQLEHFLQVVRGEEPPVVAPADGYGALELVVATHLSIARGTAVALPLEAAGADAELAGLRAAWAVSESPGAG